MNPSPLVSVIVIGRNEGVRLENCLRSVQSAQWPGPIEIIYVDSGSTDDSVRAAHKLGASVQVIHPPFSAAAARNAGWRAARGGLVMFLDGDTELDPQFPGRALEAMVRDHRLVAAVWGHRRESAPGQSVYTRALDLDWIFPAGDTSFCGGDALFRRDALVQVDGFDASLIAGEEPELCRRMRAQGWTIRHIDAPMTRHDLGIRRFSQYWRRSVRAGHAYASVSRRFAASGDPLWRAESRRNMVHACILAAMLAMPLLCAFVLGLPQALAAAVVSLALTALAVGRTALRHRWKASGLRDALLYGVHSHLQQFPILVGQVGYWWRERTHARRALIEYR